MHLAPMIWPRGRIWLLFYRKFIHFLLKHCEIWKQGQFKKQKLLRYLRISRKREKLPQNARSCLKYDKLPKSCRATCGKPYALLLLSIKELCHAHLHVVHFVHYCQGILSISKETTWKYKNHSFVTNKCISQAFISNVS